MASLTAAGPRVRRCSEQCRMQPDGARAADISGAARHTTAGHWPKDAGQQRCAEAWRRIPNLVPKAHEDGGGGAILLDAERAAPGDLGPLERLNICGAASARRLGSGCLGCIRPPSGAGTLRRRAHPSQGQSPGRCSQVWQGRRPSIVPGLAREAAFDCSRCPPAGREPCRLCTDESAGS